LSDGFELACDDAKVNRFVHQREIEQFAGRFEAENGPMT